METKRGFNRKTISEIIQAKMREWINTLPVSMQEDVKNNYFVTGGAITSMLLGEQPNDYDVYFEDAAVLTKLANYYLDSIKTRNENGRVSVIEATNKGDRVDVVVKSAGIASNDTSLKDYQYFESQTEESLDSYFEQWKKQPKNPKPYTIAMASTNAISLYGDVQIITRFVGEPREVHKNYDFVHCTNWYSEKEGLQLQPSALEATLAKELKYVGSKNPICSIFRIKKFIERGWNITAGEMFKISWDINKLNLNDPAVLRDQLTGVDAAYFMEVLSILHKNKDKELDRTYLFEVVNRVFDTPKEIPFKVAKTKTGDSVPVQTEPEPIAEDPEF